MRPLQPRHLLPGAAALVLILVPVLTAAPVTAQTPLDRSLRVFLDCNGFRCDSDYFVEEVPWVSFVLDRQDADVHVLGTRQSTGDGGGSYTLEFRGLETFEGERITLNATTPADATEDMVREELAAMVRQGLAPFAAATPQSPQVTVLPPETGPGEVRTPEDDPWDRWTFRMGVNGFMNGESQQRFLNTSGSVSAARVTEDWKIRMGFSGSLSESEFEIGGATEVFSRESYSANVGVVRSVGTHWAVGGLALWERSTFANYEHNVRLGPAVEYNVFPYSVSNRRLLTVLYAIGAGYNQYRELTLFQETEEVLIEQLLLVGYDVTQPWGSVDVSMETSHYVAKFSDGDAWPEPQYNVQLRGGFNVRLFKGLSANLHGNVEMVRGQIQLAAGELSEQEILTRQRELATSYRYFFGFGLTYRFGSIFTSVVNPRFDGVM